jgi:hypothetical protein
MATVPLFPFPPPPPVPSLLALSLPKGSKGAAA